MPENDPFIVSLKTDWKAKKLTIPVVAELICMSPRQFARHLRGETKEKIMPVQTVAELSKNGAISQETKERYLERIRVEIKAKYHRKRKTQTGIWELVKNFYVSILSNLHQEINVSRQRHL